MTDIKQVLFSKISEDTKQGINRICLLRDDKKDIVLKFYNPLAWACPCYKVTVNEHIGKREDFYFNTIESALNCFNSY